MSFVLSLFFLVLLFSLCLIHMASSSSYVQGINALCASVSIQEEEDNGFLMEENNINGGNERVIGGDS